MSVCCLQNGKPMLDTNGEVIHAHGGSLHYENGIWYWYGENKKYTDGKNGIWTWGISCYSSADLCHWKNEGLIIPPETENPSSSLHPSRPVDRPHILYCQASGKYVCWLKLSGVDAYFTVLSADHFLGPYCIERDHVRPFGTKVGDFDLWQDENGRGYLFFEHDHNGLIAAHLSPDYLDVEAPYRDNYVGLKPPLTREGVTHFTHGGKHYLLTSGMTGYVPNESEIAVSDDPLGPYIIIGNPHRGDDSGVSYNSQVSDIVACPGHPGVFITLADRWIPSLNLTAKESERIRRGQTALLERRWWGHIRDMVNLSRYPWDCGKVNTSLATYVWLPLTFEEGKPVIHCMDTWNIGKFGGEAE